MKKPMKNEFHNLKGHLESTYQRVKRFGNEYWIDKFRMITQTYNQKFFKLNNNNNNGTVSI